MYFLTHSIIFRQLVRDTEVRQLEERCGLFEDPEQLSYSLHMLANRQPPLPNISLVS